MQLSGRNKKCLNELSFILHKVFEMLKSGNLDFPLHYLNTGITSLSNTSRFSSEIEISFLAFENATHSAQTLSASKLYVTHISFTETKQN